MTLVGDFHFIRPAWLLLIPCALGIWWQVRSVRDPLRGWRAVMDPRLLHALAIGETRRNHGRGWGPLVAWLLAIVAVAGPTWRPEPSPFADDPVPIMLVLKAGESMNQSDLMPSRMERARLKVADFAAERKGQPLGLVAYAGSAHLVLPPTRDTSVVATMGAEISPPIMPKPGDDLASALRLAARTLGDTNGAIIVLADTVSAGSDTGITDFRSQHQLPIYFLAVARGDTPEYNAIQQVATTLSADVTKITPDRQDVRQLVRRAANVPVAVKAASVGVRWAEAGWYIVPLLALVALNSFRRIENLDPIEADG